MGSKSIKKNYIYNVIYQMLIIIIPVIVTPYLSRVLESDGIGKYSFANSLISYFTIFASLGFGYYAQREIAKYQNDPYKKSIIFWEIIICRLAPVLIAIAFNLILIVCGVYGSYTTLMLVFTINIISVAFDISFYFQGTEEFGKLVTRNLIIRIFTTIAIFLFVKEKDDIWKYCLIHSVSIASSSLIFWFDLKKLLKPVKTSDLKPFRHLPGTLKLFVPTIAASVYTVMDKTMIGLITGSDFENGYYEQAEKIVKLLLTLITCLGTVMIPRNTHELSEGNVENVKKNVYNSARYVWFLGLPIMFGVIAVSDNFVPWFLGEGYMESSLLLKIFSPLILIIGFSDIVGLQYLLPHKYDNRYTFSIVFGAVSNFVLNLILITYFGAIGAAIATIASELIITLTMFSMVSKKLSLKKILSSSWKPLIASVAMFLVTFFVGRTFSPSIMHTFMIVGLGVVVYFALLLILKEEYTMTTVSKMEKFLKKKKVESN